MVDLNKRLPLSICGMGRFATRRILPAIDQCPEFELVSVVNHSGINGDLPASVRQFASLDAFLEEKPAGSIYIASPSFLHAQHSIKCSLAGLHVLCEKPMATNNIDCHSMINVARDNNLQLWVGHMLRYSPALELARSWFRMGLIGELLSIDAIFHYELVEIDRPWAFRSGHFGGGALMDAGIHCIDAIRSFATGPISALSTIMDSHLHNDRVERKAKCNFRFGAVDCQLDIDSRAPYMTSLAIRGSGGTVAINNFAATWGEVAVELFVPHESQPVKSSLIDVSNIYCKQLRSFAKAVANPDLAATQDYSAAENVRVIEELYSITSILL